MERMGMAWGTNQMNIGISFMKIKEDGKTLDLEYAKEDNEALNGEGKANNNNVPCMREIILTCRGIIIPRGSRFSGTTTILTALLSRAPLNSYWKICTIYLCSSYSFQFLLFWCQLKTFIILLNLDIQWSSLVIIDNDKFS